MINNRNYDWSSITIKMPGLELEVQSIDYDDELEKELSYGMGNRPRGYGTGNYKSEGKLSLLRDDYHQLLDYCRDQNTAFYKLVIPKITVSYANDGEPTRTDVLSLVTFTKRSGKASQGDKNLKVDLDMMIVGGIEMDGVAAV